MNGAARQNAAVLAAGALFGVGLAISGMTDPRKVIGFLDFAGAWNASLLFVMGGAVGVHAVAYRWLSGRSSPLFGARVALPPGRDIDRRLLLGAAVFGVGWGLAGYCPGPGVVSLGAGETSALVFVAAMLVGMVAAARLERRNATTAAGEPAEASGGSGRCDRQSEPVSDG